MRAYLDNHATTPIDPRVLEAMQVAFSQHFGNPSSSNHAWGWAAQELVTIATEQIAKAFNCKNSEIIFTSGATESINLALRGLLKNNKNNSQIICSAIEHKVTFDVLKYLVSEGVQHKVIPVSRIGMLDLEQFEKELKNFPTFMTSIIAANNEIGCIQDLKAISALCHRYRTLLHLDMSQAVGRMPINLKDIGCDLATFSAHKAYGPKGVGCLYIKESLKDTFQGLIVGTGQQEQLRSGTLNVPGIVGMGKAFDLACFEREEIVLHCNSLRNTLLKCLLTEIPELIINTSLEQSICGNLNISLPNISAAKLISKLAGKVAISSSSACLNIQGHSSHVLKAIGLNQEQVDSTIRIGIGRFNSEDEILFAAKSIINAVFDRP